MSNYADFLARKTAVVQSTGISQNCDLPDGLFPHQVDLVRWALRRGRAAIFADTGLGKSRMQLAWANAIHRAIGVDVLILAPLAVASQTVMEGAAIGIGVTLCRSGDDVRPGLNITNYERLHKFDASRFGAIVLDESSCIKHQETKTFATLVDLFRDTPYKLCATATPAPNDWTELGTHAEFLGICTRQEMLAEYFVHDGGETQVWRLKGHARKAFWRWVSTWGAMVRKPSDLGHDDSAYALPPLTVTDHISRADGYAAEEGMLFALEASSLSERRAARKASLDGRAKACAEMVNASSDYWMIWCDLNAEADALRSLIPDAVEIRGTDDIDDKERKLADFTSGKIRVLLTKPSIAGWGLNAQHCANIAFVGVTDSFEAYYQAVRRCWRFGQKRPVSVHIFTSDMEGAVLTNIRRKEADALAMADSLSQETREAVNAEVHGQTRMVNNYQPRVRISAPAWLISEAA